MKDLIPVHMTPEECALFILFQKHYKAIGFMMATGVFDVRQGNVILSFDSQGSLKSIKRELFNYEKDLSTPVITDSSTV